MDLIVIALIIILPLIAQSIITSTYKKFSKIDNSASMSGKDVARLILDKNGLKNVSISEIDGSLTDHYDPKAKHINLSNSIYNDKSISAIAVAAHECGHAIQDKEHYTFLTLRSKMVPLVNFTSRISSILIMIGFFTEFIKLVNIGIIMLSVGLLFQFITLPVEFNASNRARKQLISFGLIADKDIKGTKKVLSAAAFTYVAGFLASALQIARLVLINRNR